MTSNEEFPYVDNYNDLIEGRTLTKRGQWWTAILLVQPKDNDDPSKRKIVIQRWKKTGDLWRPTKSFTISSPRHYEKLKETIDKWINDGTWPE